MAKHLTGQKKTLYLSVEALLILQKVKRESMSSFVSRAIQALWEKEQEAK